MLQDALEQRSCLFATRFLFIVKTSFGEGETARLLITTPITYYLLHFTYYKSNITFYEYLYM